MPAISITQLIFVSVAGLLIAMLPILFFQARRAERVLRSMQKLLLEPDRSKLNDAKDLVNSVMDDAVSKITDNFTSHITVLTQHVARAEAMEKKLSVDNKMLVSTADIAFERIANMTRTLENLIGNMLQILENPQWKNVLLASDNFNNGVNNLIKELDQKSNSIVDLTAKLNKNIVQWSDNGQKLSDELQQNIADNTDKMNTMSIAVRGFKDELSSLQHSVTTDFENVKLSSQGIENILSDNEKLLAHQLGNMQSFTEQARKLLQQQVNTMADTANRIGTDIRLAESSICSGTDKLNETTEKLFTMSNTIKETFDCIANEIINIRAKFQSEIGEFSEMVVNNLHEAQNTTTHTMQDAEQIARSFRDSLIPMLGSINETVVGLTDAKDHIQPLAELMNQLQTAMPEFSQVSTVVAEDLSVKLSTMAEKINEMRSAAEGALTGIGNSTMALEKLSGESRQQMIELMGDYAKAANTMRELTNSMAEVRASAPMKSMSASAGIKVSNSVGASISVQDFIKQIDSIMEKLHDLSVDLTRSIGAEIPDSVMEKYNKGDRAIFSKWFAKMISSADKKRVRNMFKTDAVFRSQATQFVHSFAKMVAGAERTENKEMVVATLLKTDLGIMYQSLKACL